MWLVGLVGEVIFSPHFYLDDLDLRLGGYGCVGTEPLLPQRTVMSDDAQPEELVTGLAVACSSRSSARRHVGDSSCSPPRPASAPMPCSATDARVLLRRWARMRRSLWRCTTAPTGPDRPGHAFGSTRHTSCSSSGSTPCWDGAAARQGPRRCSAWSGGPGRRSVPDSWVTLRAASTCRLTWSVVAIFWMADPPRGRCRWWTLIAIGCGLSTDPAVPVTDEVLYPSPARLRLRRDLPRVDRGRRSSATRSPSAS